MGAEALFVIDKALVQRFHPLNPPFNGIGLRYQAAGRQPEKPPASKPAPHKAAPRTARVAACESSSAADASTGQ